MDHQSNGTLPPGIGGLLSAGFFLKPASSMSDPPARPAIDQRAGLK
jgi:hypothetical protein